MAAEAKRQEEAANKSKLPPEEALQAPRGSKRHSSTPALRGSVLQQLKAVRSGAAKWCRKCAGLFDSHAAQLCPNSHPNFVYVKPAPELLAQLEVAEARIRAASSSAFSMYFFSVMSCPTPTTPTPRPSSRTRLPKQGAVGRVRRPPLQNSS